MAWISGEVPVLLVVGALLSQWAKQDRKDNKRTERHQDAYPEDDELVAYNAMLAQLGKKPPLVLHYRVVIGQIWPSRNV